MQELKIHVHSCLQLMQFECLDFFARIVIYYRLLFFSYDYMAAEFIKSRIRKNIIEEFAKEGLQFPSLSQELLIRRMDSTPYFEKGEESQIS